MSIQHKGRSVTEQQLQAYATDTWSDTFCSYNDAIILSVEVLRLRRERDKLLELIPSEKMKRRK